MNRSQNQSMWVAAAVAVLSLPAFAADYEVDSSHSSADFSVRHMMVTNVRGTFGKVSGTLQLDEKDVTRSKVEAVIDATSINTNEPKRDGHLKSPDFFDVEKHPTLTFKSTKVTKKGKKLAVTGDLTIRGVTRQVVLDVEELTAPVKDPWGQTKIGAVATTRLNRRDFGLTWNKALETGGMLVGEEVKVQLNLQFNAKQKQTAAAQQ